MKLAMNSIKELLSNEWKIRGSKSTQSPIVGKDGVEICGLIATTQMAHWDEEYHEIMVFECSPRALSGDGLKGHTAVETYRFYHWKELRKFLAHACVNDFWCHADSFNYSKSGPCIYQMQGPCADCPHDGFC